MKTTTPDVRRPNIFVVGDAKCGTTSLFRLLQLTPGTGTPRTRKELHFFAAPELLKAIAGPGDDVMRHRIVEDAATYMAEFAHIPSTVQHIVEVSPSYLHHREAAERIKAFCPDARIVIILRDPASKIFSQYLHLWSEGRETLSFEEAFSRSKERRISGYSAMFDYESGGLYSQSVANYIEIFGRAQVSVQIFEEFFGAKTDARLALETFLGITLPMRRSPHLNRGGLPRSRLVSRFLNSARIRCAARTMLPLSLYTTITGWLKASVIIVRPELHPSTRASLGERYAADTARLETLIGCATNWPLIPDMPLPGNAPAAQLSATTGAPA
jgi:hypothetical protein